jgi:hypothetical protein
VDRSSNYYHCTARRDASKSFSSRLGTLLKLMEVANRSGMRCCSAGVKCTSNTLASGLHANSVYPQSQANTHTHTHTHTHTECKWGAQWWTRTPVAIPPRSGQRLPWYEIRLSAFMFALFEDTELQRTVYLGWGPRNYTPDYTSNNINSRKK